MDLSSIGSSFTQVWDDMPPFCMIRVMHFIIHLCSSLNRFQSARWAHNSSKAPVLYNLLISMFVIIQKTRARRMNSLAGGWEERNPDVSRNRSCATESRIASTEATKRKDFAAVRLLAIHHGHTKGTPRTQIIVAGHPQGTHFSFCQPQGIHDPNFSSKYSELTDFSRMSSWARISLTSLLLYISVAVHTFLPQGNQLSGVPSRVCTYVCSWEFGLAFNNFMLMSIWCGMTHALTRLDGLQDNLWTHMLSNIRRC